MNEHADFGNNKVILVCLNQSYENYKSDCRKTFSGIRSRKNLEDCIRKYWSIKDLEKANQADYIVGTYKTEIVAVYKFDKSFGWKQVKDYEEIQDKDEIADYPDLLLRYACHGELVAGILKNGEHINKEKGKWLGTKSPKKFYNCYPLYNY